MKIRFRLNHRPKGDAENIPSYKAGEVYAFDGPVSEGYAKKYIRLGLALEAVDEPAVVAVEEPALLPVVEDVVEEVVADDPPVVDFQRRPGKHRK